MRYTYLDWDSKFFGRRIGKIDFSEQDNEHSLMEEIERHSNLDLLYIFAPLTHPLLEHKSKFKLVDQKVTYGFNQLSEGVVRVQPDNRFEINDYESTTLNSELEQLAYQSGVYSRFKTDPNFGQEAFQRLYKEWIANSVSRKLADHVFVARYGNEIVGMVTVKYETGSAIIGLFAVDERFRGMKVGSMLIDHIREECRRESINQITVATQNQNRAACQFYERNGFTLRQTILIYHYWMKP